MHAFRLAFFAFVPLLTAAHVPAASRAAPVTRVQIRKSAHTLELYRGEELFASYRVAIGPGGAGPKTREGDMVTPVGRYHVVSRRPSQYRLFLSLDYPNSSDWERFLRLKREGRIPAAAAIGGSIGIHGPPIALPEETKANLKASDWTAGCIAVDDDEIQDIAHAVPDGTPVDIED